MSEGSDSDYGPDFYSLIGKALSEPGFRETLRSSEDRRGELEKMGITLTPDQEEDLDRAIQAVEDLARHFGVELAAT